MACESSYRIFEFASKRIRNVTNSRGTVCKPLQLCRRDAGRSHHRDSAEARTLVFAEGLDFQISESFAMFRCNVGNREGETGRYRAQQHLGRPGSGIVAPNFDRLIDRQLELADFYLTPIPAVPAGGDASHG